MLLFNIKLSDYDATIVSKLSLCFICSIHERSIINLALRLNYST